MRNRRSRTTATLLLLSVFAAAPLVLAAPHEGGGHDHDAAAGVDPAMMEALAKAAAPGEHHAHLAKSVGAWNAQMKMWMAPGAEPMRTTGTMTIEPILGGRFFRSVFNTEMMGQPFEGIAIDGYDNVLGKHTGTWMDSMGTMTMVFEGDCSDGGRVMTMRSDFIDPITRGPGAMKATTTIVDAKTIKWEAWNLMPDGTFYKSMESVYTRR